MGGWQELSTLVHQINNDKLSTSKTSFCNVYRILISIPIIHCMFGSQIPGRPIKRNQPSGINIKVNSFVKIHVSCNVSRLSILESTRVQDPLFKCRMGTFFYCNSDRKLVLFPKTIMYLHELKVSL